MGDDTLAHPHDTLLRRAFSRLDNASALLRSVLPASVVEAVDWASVEPER
jgi:hypothetical protein